MQRRLRLRCGWKRSDRRRVPATCGPTGTGGGVGALTPGFRDDTSGRRIHARFGWRRGGSSTAGVTVFAKGDGGRCIAELTAGLTTLSETPDLLRSLMVAVPFERGAERVWSFYRDCEAPCGGNRDALGRNCDILSDSNAG